MNFPPYMYHVCIHVYCIVFNKIYQFILIIFIFICFRLCNKPTVTFLFCTIYMGVQNKHIICYERIWFCSFYVIAENFIVWSFDNLKVLSLNITFIYCLIIVKSVLISRFWITWGVATRAKPQALKTIVTFFKTWHVITNLYFINNIIYIKIYFLLLVNWSIIINYLN